MLELPAEAKEKIRAEEIFRNEVREELAKTKKGRWQEVWTIVNSPFLIAVFSGVVLAFLGWIYQQYDQYARKHESQKVQQQKLATEVQNRIDAAMNVLKDKDQQTREARIRLDGRAVSPIYPEFQERPLVSMLVELKAISPSKEKKQEMEPVIETFRSPIQDKKSFETNVNQLKTTIEPLLPK